MAREKWLELELERQRQLTDASTEQLACAEKDKQQLRHKIQQLEVSRCHCTSRQLWAVCCGSSEQRQVPSSRTQTDDLHTWMAQYIQGLHACMPRASFICSMCAPHYSFLGRLLCLSQNTLAQHETYAKLEAQGAQHVEMEMRKMHLQLKERTIELRSLQQELDGAKAQIRADQEAGAALGAAAASTSSTL